MTPDVQADTNATPISITMPREQWRALTTALRRWNSANPQAQAQLGRYAWMAIAEIEGECGPITPEAGKWGVVMDDDGEMARVRWSIPGKGGAHLYVRHYPGTAWGKNAAESEARNFNEIGKSPFEWSCYKPPDAPEVKG